MMDRNDFHRLSENLPDVPESFDHRVRKTLDNLPERPKRARRRPFRFFVTIGIAAALCLSGTALAVNVKSLFPMFFPANEDEAITGFITTPEPGSTVVSNGDYEAECTAVLYDEHTGTGIVSLRLTDLKHTGITPFELAHVYSYYEGKDDLVWSRLVECYGNKDGQLDFSVLFNETNFGHGKFYLDETHSSGDTYYIEGAFILPQEYTPGTPVRVEIAQQGNYMTFVDDFGCDMVRLAPILTLELPESAAIPYLSSEDGSIILSQLGIHVEGNGFDVDNLDEISVMMKDGTTLDLLDEENDIDCSLYALGESSPGSDVYDITTRVLSKGFDIENVEAVILNGKIFPLS